MRLSIVNGLAEDQEGFDTQMKMLKVFEEALQLQQRKASNYGEAWRGQGYMGNVARVLSKASRLKKMLWQDFEIGSHDETVEDTAMDMINILGFFIINKTEGNKWGR